MKISELPKEYRKLADRNRDNSSDYIDSAFVWDNTPEGGDFWHNCYFAKSVDDLPPIPNTSMAKDSQVGGNHYRDMEIQPIDFILGNDLGFVEGNIIKYICRYKDKGGKKDIEKIIHYAEILKERINNEKK